MIVGGTNTTGNGASKLCLLVKETDYENCIVPNLNLDVQGLATCFGSPSKVKVTSSEANTIYTAYLAGKPISASKAGGGNLEIDIPGNQLMPGNNIINIRAEKIGCISYFLRDTGIVTASFKQINTPVITASGQTEFCNGGSVKLEAPLGYSSYLWSNGSIGNEITVSESGHYSVKVFDESGCSSLASLTIPVTVYKDKIVAGADESICSDTPSFLLSGFHPVGGTWSGKGISSEGVFNPDLAGIGSHTLTYTTCSLTDVKEITVNRSPVIPPFTVKTQRDTICMNASTSIEVSNTSSYVYYTLYDGDKIVGYHKSGPGTLFFPTDNLTKTTQFKIIANTFTNYCGALTIEKTVTAIVAPTPIKVPAFAEKDTLCKGEIPVIKVVSEVGVKYKIVSSDYDNPSIIGNGDTLQLSGATNYKNKYIIEATSSTNCYPVAIATIPITYYQQKADFNASQEGYFIGDSVMIFNNSTPGNTYEWSFGSTASIASSTEKQPKRLMYNSIGVKTVKLKISNSTFGCVDSTSKTIEIFNPVASRNISLCQKDLFDGKYVVTDYHLDKNKNSHLTGYYYASGGGNFLAFAAKLDSLGGIVWLKEQTIAESGFGTAITTDDSGNSYLTGHFSGGSFFFGAYKIYSFDTYPKMFVIKYDKDGNEKWIIQGSKNLYDREGSFWGSDIICDTQNRIFVAGYRTGSGTISFISGDNIVLNSDTPGCFFFQIDTAGSLKDFKEFGSTDAYKIGNHAFVSANNSNYSNASLLAVSPRLNFSGNGDILVAGAFYSWGKDYTFNFGNKTLSLGIAPPSGSAASSSFIAVYNKSEGWKKAFKIVDHGSGYLKEFKEDQDGNIYAIGTLYQKSIIGADTLNIPNTQNSWELSYLSKTSPEGNSLWYTTTKASYFHDIEISKDNSALVTGAIRKFGGIYSSDKTPYGLQGKGTGDIYFAEYNSEGKVLWANVTGGEKNDWPSYIELDKCNNIFLIANVDKKGDQYGSEIGLTGLFKYSLSGICNSINCSPIQLTISNVTPLRGPYETQITIVGKDFVDVETVKIGETVMAFSVINDKEITATIPQGASTGKIIIKTAQGTASSAEGFLVLAPTAITSFTPASGGWGDIITVTGNNLYATDSVFINGVPCSFEFSTNQKIYIRVSYFATTGKISIKTKGGIGHTNEDFIIAPIITSITPVTGPPGSIITILGKNLEKPASVKFNGTTSDVYASQYNEIKAWVPEGATTGKIVITNSRGTVSSAIDFTVTQSPPTISSFTPQIANHSATITIKGTNYSNVSSVKFNGVDAVYTVKSTTEIIATVPSGATFGKITITTPGGTATSSDNFYISYPMPTILAFSPQTGMIGSSVAITGTNFSTASSVEVNGIPAAYSITNSTEITIIIPSGATSGKITVTNSGGTATSLSNFTVTIPPSTITSFIPASGAAGTTITITGTKLLGTAMVKFNGTTAEYFVIDDTQISAKVPLGATTGKIELLTAGGIATSQIDFEVNTNILIPSIASFNPTAGLPGQVVIIYGQNFSSITSLRFNGISSSYSVVSNSIITAFVPANATSGKISIGYANGIISSIENFTVLIHINPPSNLITNAVDSSIGLSWKDNSHNEKGFIVEKLNDNTLQFLPVDTVGENATTYKDIKVKDQAIKSYRIYAYNGPSRSEYSNTAKGQLSSITGLEEDLISAGITIYPNPFKDIIKVEIKDASGLGLSVSNILGTEILKINSRDIVGTTVLIDLSKEKEGIYLLRIDTKKKSFMVRIIKN